MRLLVVLATLALVSCATSATSPVPQTATEPAPAVPSVEPPSTLVAPPPPAWQPTGDGWRSQVADTGQTVWFRKVTGEGCPGGQRYCLNYEVATEDGCDTLYVQASLVSEAGQNVDWTNAVARGLRAKEVGRISLGATQQGRFRLDEVSCR